MSQPNAPVTAIRINDDGDQMILNRTCHLVELVLSVIESMFAINPNPGCVCYFQVSSFVEKIKGSRLFLVARGRSDM